MLQNYWKFPNRNDQTCGFVYHDTNGLNHGPVWKTQSFLLNEICMVIPLAGLLWERQFEKILLQQGWEKIPNWECLFVHREKGLFLSVYVDDIKFSGKKENIDPIWKVLKKEVDLGEPTSFLDHVCLGCAQRQCETSKDVVDNCWTMFESSISAGAIEKLPCSENLSVSSWSYDLESHAKKCVERYCELANKTTQQLYKVSTPCIDDHHFNEEELKSVGELSKSMLSNCSEMLKLGTNWTTWYRNLTTSTQSLPFTQNLRISSWSYDMAGHAKKCVERYCDLANKSTQQLYKVSTPCIEDHHFKEEEMKSVGELSSTCSQIVLKCFFLGTYWETWYSMVS